MLRALERRLRRLIAADCDRRNDTDERAAATARRVLAQAVRTALAQLGLDPETATALREAAATAATAAPAAADPMPVSPHRILAERLAALAERHRGTGPPILAEASLASLFATYCLGGLARAAAA